MRLIDVRSSDGSRHFARLPKTAPWDALREHVARLSGVETVSLVVPGPIGPWLDFTFRGHFFRVHNGGQEFHFFVRDPRCSDVSLYQVASHCEKLLADPPADSSGI